MYASSPLQLCGLCLVILVQIDGGDDCKGCRGLGSTRLAMMMSMRTWMQSVYARTMNGSCGSTRALFPTPSDHGLQEAVEKSEGPVTVRGCLSGRARANPAAKKACRAPFVETTGQTTVREYTRPL